MGSDTQSTELPSWVTDASQKNIKDAERIAALGYVPYIGPDVAALSSGERAAHKGNIKAAKAFGLPAGKINQDLPRARNYNGVEAYSAFPMYAAALEELKNRYPEKYAMLMGQMMAAQGGGMPQQQPPIMNTEWGTYEVKRGY